MCLRGGTDAPGVDRSNKPVDAHNRWTAFLPSYIVYSEAHNANKWNTITEPIESAEINTNFAPAENRPKHTTADKYNCSVIIVSIGDNEFKTNHNIVTATAHLSDR